jgi:NADH-quinone oxidoreductase subunit L
MTFALVVLAILSVVGGLVGIPYALGHFIHVPNLFEGWLEPVFAHGEHAVHHEVAVVEYFLMALSVGVALAAIGVAVYMYVKRKELPAGFVARFPRLYRWVHDKYYIDEFYQAVFVRNLLRINELMAAFDNKVIDGLVNFSAVVVRKLSDVSGFVDNTFVDGLVNLLADTVRFTGAQLRKVQTGLVQNYLYLAMAGVIVLMIWKLF